MNDRSIEDEQAAESESGATAHDDSAAPDGSAAPDDDRWGVNAAIGAAAIAARTAGEVVDAVGSSAPGRVMEGAARWLTRPLAREGEEVRTRLEEEAVPAAQQAIRQATPSVVQAVDVNEILAAIDVNALLDRIDINRLVDRIDVGAIVAKVDLNALVAQIDVDAVVAQVDIGGLIARVDLDSLLASIDLDALLARLDIGAVLERIDLDVLLARIDLNSLLASVDINELMQRLDMDALVSNTELGSIIAQSTSGVASEALDVVRSQGVGMDNFIARLTNRALRRDPAELPAGPPLLVDAQLALPASRPESRSEGADAAVGADGTIQ